MGTIHSSANPNSLPGFQDLSKLLVSVLTNGDVARLSSSEIHCTVKILWPHEDDQSVGGNINRLLAQWVAQGLVEVAEDDHYSVADPALLFAEIGQEPSQPAA